ncbi:DUF4270 domain-containing protein [Flavobacterium sp. CF136]|uniref:DUF4270 domain-containing protein n=1 Tax=Flavobacterium sp. (strain CF136) TaxID=1144313 RepID=UPI000271D236|nr:DUF4270 domain-containing protein [Flavobacterium sp. CF136]EJL63298.1 hypothetical protein PMI10_02441 [Flavobacterium sp. CF136]
MYNTSFIKKILLIATVAFFYSCDKDFNAIGDDLIGNDHFDLTADIYSVNAYNQKVTPVASNNLAVNALGIFENPVFATTTANFNTQVSLTSYAPDLGEGVAIDSVTLNIPYFVDASKTTTTAEGISTYTLDSIYGPVDGKIKLSVYESGVFLNTYNANNYDVSKFYSTDRNSDFQTQAEALGARLNDAADQSENDGFFFNSKEITEKTPKTETTAEIIKRIKPEMRLHLNKDFFKTKIFGATANQLAADDVFKNYFKGLYFKVEKSGILPSTMAMLDFKSGKINIFYKAKTAITTDAETVMESRSLVINLTGNTVSLLEESNPNSNYTTAAANDKVADEKLYLKGGQGSMAVIELFGEDLIQYGSDGNVITTPNNVPDELDEIRHNYTAKNWRVNEANLVFHIDANTMAGAIEPNRIYLYDLTNNTILNDYSFDGSTSITGDPKKAKSIFGGMINVDANKRGTTYKIRITNYIRSIMRNAAVANVKLGLVVTEDINTTASAKLDKTKINVGSAISEVPRASVMSPLGTVLYGGIVSQNVPEEKKLKLEIYYTKPN